MALWVSSSNFVFDFPSHSQHFNWSDFKYCSTLLHGSLLSLSFTKLYFYWFIKKVLHLSLYLFFLLKSWNWNQKTKLRTLDTLFIFYNSKMSVAFLRMSTDSTWLCDHSMKLLYELKFWYEFFLSLFPLFEFVNNRVQRYDIIALQVLPEFLVSILK